MTSIRRSSVYAWSLLAGGLLVGVGGVRHPMLAGDGAADLAAIAAAGGWYAIHWAFLFGFALAVAGLAGLGSLLAGSPGERAARAGICLAVFGYAVAAVGVLFMVGAGTTLADAFRRADLGLTATHAVFVYDMLRPFAQGSIRAGAFAVALAVYAFGWAVATGGVLPRLLGYLGVAMGVVGALTAAALPETSLLVVLGTGLATVWQLLAGVAMLLDRRPAAA